MDLVSIIIPAYNAENFIRISLQSAISQTYSNIEIIVADDGSVDDTVAIATATLKKDFKGAWRVIELCKNSGVSVARNAALRAARGVWVQSLDADDFLMPVKIERQMAICGTVSSDVAGVFSPWRQMFKVGEHIEWAGPILMPTLEGKPPIMNLVYERRGHHGAFLLRHSALNEVGGFDKSLRFWEDMNILVRLAEGGGRFVSVPSDEPLYLWRIHRHKPHIGGTEARYLKTDVAVGWIKQVLQAADNRSLNELGLAKDDQLSLLRECTSYARLLYPHDRDAFREYMVKARILTPQFNPTHPWYLSLLSRVLGYENAEAVAQAARGPRKFLRVAFE